MTLTDVRTYVPGAARVWLVIGLWGILGFVLAYVGFQPLGLYMFLCWVALVFPHGIVTFPGTNAFVFPGLLAPAVAILQWILVGLFAGWCSRSYRPAGRLMFAMVAVGVAGTVVYVMTFWVFKFGFRMALP